MLIRVHFLSFLTVHKNEASYVDKQLHEEKISHRMQKIALWHFPIRFVLLLCEYRLLHIVHMSYRFARKYILESNLFAMQIAKNLNALKLVMTYTDLPIIPTNSIYGIDRFTKIIKKNDIIGEPLSMFYASIEAVRSGVQGVNFVDINQTSFLEEICSSAPSGLFLYDDLLGQL